MDESFKTKRLCVKDKAYVGVIVYIIVYTRLRNFNKIRTYMKPTRAVFRTKSKSMFDYFVTCSNN